MTIKGNNPIHSTIQKLTISLLLASICGCSNTTIGMDPKEMTFAGPGSLFEQTEFEQLNLCNSLIKHGLATYKADGATELMPEDSRSFLPDEAPEKYCQLVEITNDVPYQIKRNEFVSHIMSLSEQRCGVFYTFMIRDKANMGTWLGGLSLLFTGVATGITHPQTIKAFTATAGATTALNSVYDEERYASLAINVITMGIQNRRSSIRKEVEDKYEQPILKYPVNAAIADAIRYHAACQLSVGLEEASSSLEKTPKLDVLTEQYNKILKLTTKAVEKTTKKNAASEIAPEIAPETAPTAAAKAAAEAEAAAKAAAEAVAVAAAIE